jgi:S-adenosylmethionine:tRNA ribosyltransferase-isomerase
MTETVTAGGALGATVGAAPGPGGALTGRAVAAPAADDAGTSDAGTSDAGTSDAGTAGREAAPETTGPGTPVPETSRPEGAGPQEARPQEARPQEARPQEARPDTVPPRRAGREGTGRERSGPEAPGRVRADVRGRFDFTLPAELEATAPPEARGRSRDGVRLLTARRTPDGADEDTLTHGAFTDLPGLLRPGDLLVVNTSPTLPAAVRLDRIAVHFSTPLPNGCWLVELREISRAGHPPRTAGGTVHAAGGTSPEGTAGAGSASGSAPGSAPGSASPAAGSTSGSYAGGEPGEWLPLPGGATLTLLSRHTPRLWRAALDTPVVPYLHRHGVPIRYGYVTRDWPLAAYQTVFARAGQDGGAEMPSAGRAFTTELVTRLVAGGVLIAPITLHTGVASPEAHEPPYPERFRVPATTASVVNDVRSRGGRVIAVGTTVVRALETATGEDGRVRAAHGWTDLVVTPELGVRAVDGLLTGLHEPRSSHLRMLTAIAGDALVERSYAAALDGRYLWHEFGDLNLLLP